MKSPMISTVSIDKISAVRNVDNNFVKTIAGMIINETKDISSGCIQTKSQGAYGICIKIYPFDAQGNPNFKSHFLYFQVNYKTGQIRIEFNPSKFTDETYEYMDVFCLGIMGQSFLEFLAGAKITRIDLNTHIFGHTAEDFLFKFKNFRVSQTVCGQSGKIETIYAGRTKGNHFKIYDKAKQLNGQDYPLSCLRIEGTLRSNTYFGHLPYLKNPFNRVVIYDLVPKKLPKDIHPGHWQGFVDSARLRGGVNTALKMQPKSSRGKLKYYLSDKVIEWWKPEIFWGEKWLETLEDCNLLNLPPAKPLTLQTAAGDKIKAANDSHPVSEISIKNIKK